MKQLYLINEQHSELLLFFTGWAADKTPFEQYVPAGMDYMICYDYRNLDFDASLLQAYRKIHVVGWSMGVWAAAQVRPLLPDCAVETTAFNGSTAPIDDEAGIPTALFDGTLDGLTPASLQKFMRRMCSDSRAYKAFMEITPRRDFDEIKEELRLVKEQYLHGTDRHMTYDHVYIGRNDRIFPTDNLLRNHADTPAEQQHVADTAHYDEPTFRYLLQERYETNR